jgi:hypothetical protein
VPNLDCAFDPPKADYKAKCRQCFRQYQSQEAAFLYLLIFIVNTIIAGQEVEWLTAVFTEETNECEVISMEDKLHAENLDYTSELDQL